MLDAMRLHFQLPLGCFVLDTCSNATQCCTTRCPSLSKLAPRGLSLIQATPLQVDVFQKAVPLPEVGELVKNRYVVFTSHRVLLRCQFIKNWSGI
jgi:hypothetical protein